MATPADSTARRAVTRVRGALRSAEDDDLAVEEPLEIRVAGDTVAVTMRTPGDDVVLTLGFLLAEGIIAARGDLCRVTHCGKPGTPEYANTVDAVPAPGVALDVDRSAPGRRGTLTSSACGVCGRRSIDDLIRRCGPVDAGPAIRAGRVLRCVEDLRARQGVFSRTGGVHAAAVFRGDGGCVACYEDVGRHNAVDKAVGALLEEGRLGARGEERPALLAVSGRSSFEIVQKAAVARIPIVASVSAPSSMAADLAKDLGITLAGFCRKDGMNIYSHPDRILPDGNA